MNRPGPVRPSRFFQVWDSQDEIHTVKPSSSPPPKDTGKGQSVSFQASPFLLSRKWIICFLYARRSDQYRPVKDDQKENALKGEDAVDPVIALLKGDSPRQPKEGYCADDQNSKLATVP